MHSLEGLRPLSNSHRAPSGIAIVTTAAGASSPHLSCPPRLTLRCLDGSVIWRPLADPFQDRIVRASAGSPARYRAASMSRLTRWLLKDRARSRCPCIDYGDGIAVAGPALLRCIDTYP